MRRKNRDQLSKGAEAALTMRTILDITPGTTAWIPEQDVCGGRKRGEAIISLIPERITTNPETADQLQVYRHHPNHGDDATEFVVYAAKEQLQSMPLLTGLAVGLVETGDAHYTDHVELITPYQWGWNPQVLSIDPEWKDGEVR